MPPTAFKFLRVFNVDYAYLDSGPPTSSQIYTTWVFVHGMGFNGAIIAEKLFPIAHAHNLRIVCIFRRGYPPSSEFREEELAQIGFGKKIDEAEPFLRAQGTEIATFIAQFATEASIPPVSDPNDPNTGGIALVGWSFGGIHMLALLAYFDELLDDTQSTLRKYLHTVVSHDANAHALGIPDTPRFHGKSLTELENRSDFKSFFDWVTAHYVHRSVISENPDDLTPGDTSTDIPSSLHDLSDAQRAAYTNPGAYVTSGCDAKLLLCDTTAFAALTKRALFNKACAASFPQVRVRYMSGGTSLGWLVWSLWMLRKYAENPAEAPCYGSDAERARDIKFVAHPEGNHFVFWNDPEKAIEQYRVTIDS